MKKFRDAFGEQLKVGQRCANVFVKKDGAYGEPLGFRKCKVIKINPKSVRVRYLREDDTFGENNVYRTTNRLVILSNIPDRNYNVAERERWDILDFRED